MRAPARGAVALLLCIQQLILPSLGPAAAQELDKLTGSEQSRGSEQSQKCDRSWLQRRRHDRHAERLDWNRQRVQRPWIVGMEVGQPSVWSLAQAHYLLANVHEAGRALRLARLTEDALDPNRVNAARLEILRTLLGLEAQFDESVRVKNRAEIDNFEDKQALRAEARAALPAREAELRKLDRELLELELRAASLKKEDQLADAARGMRPANPEEARRKVEIAALDKEIEIKSARRTNLQTEITSLRQTASAEVAAPAVTTAGPEAGQANATFPAASALDGFVTKFLAETASSPTVAASIALDNYLGMQYEIVAKQLTLLRDEVGPEERVIFLELPASVYTTDKWADGYVAQVEWRVSRYFEKEPDEDVKRKFLCEDLEKSNRSAISILQALNRLPGTRISPDRAEKEECLERVRARAVLETMSDLASWPGAEEEVRQAVGDVLAYMRRADDERVADIAGESLRRTGMQDRHRKEVLDELARRMEPDQERAGEPTQAEMPYPITLAMLVEQDKRERNRDAIRKKEQCLATADRDEKARGQEEERCLEGVRRRRNVQVQETGKCLGTASLLLTEEARCEEEEKCRETATLQEEDASREEAQCRKRAEDQGEAIGFQKDLCLEEAWRQEGAGQKNGQVAEEPFATPLPPDDLLVCRDSEDLRRRQVRTLEIIPRQSALNVNEHHATTRNTGVTGLFKWLSGFGAKVSYQQQREQYEKVLQQEVFASGFGKGDTRFGWLFGPLPGSKRIAPGQRTTYAVLAVPKNTLALEVEAIGRAFKRYDSPEEGTVVEYGKFLVRVPGERTERLWVDGIDYVPVETGKGSVTAVLSGNYFSPQVGVLVNGVPLKAARSIARVAGEEPRRQPGDGIEGEFEIPNSRQMVLSFAMPSGYVGTPIITLVTPERSTAINFFPLTINHSKSPWSLQARSRFEPMFLPAFKLQEELEEVSSADCKPPEGKGYVLYRLNGSGLRRNAEVAVEDNALKSVFWKRQICKKELKEGEENGAAFQESTGSYLLLFKKPSTKRWKVGYRALTRQGLDERSFTYRLPAEAGFTHQLRHYHFNRTWGPTGTAEVDLSFKIPGKLACAMVCLEDLPKSEGCRGDKPAGCQLVPSAGCGFARADQSGAYRIRCLVGGEGEKEKAERDFISIRVEAEPEKKNQDDEGAKADKGPKKEEEKNPEFFADIHLPVVPHVDNVMNDGTDAP